VPKWDQTVSKGLGRMSDDQLDFVVLADRPIVRDDIPTDIDFVVDIITSRGMEGEPAKHAINLCVVIDRSGSMGGYKIEQAKKSCIDIYESLTPEDHLTVLAFDTQVLSVVNPQTPKAEIEDRILALTSGGGTDLSKGWYLGLLELQTYSSEKHINRLILLSDGQANVGESKSAVLGAESARARDEVGITTSTIGIGTDFQEDILAALARESGGRFWYIGDSAIEEIIREEFSGALSVYLERPAVQLELPAGLAVLRELNDLTKVSGRYRLRPIKANDRFCFALRLRSDPANMSPISSVGATLFDGTEVISTAHTDLRLGTTQEYANSAEDPSVAMVVAKYLAAAADEEIVEQMDAGDVTTMITMLESQSQLLRDLEQKLSGERAIPWEELSERERERAERQRAMEEAELEHAIHALQQNDALISVAQLINLLQGLGAARDARMLAGMTEMLQRSRKEHKHRGDRAMGWHEGPMDAGIDRISLQRILRRARDLSQQSISRYPYAADQLNGILGDIDEQLARLS
jgi:Ca-activated chloride channel homolog